MGVTDTSARSRSRFTSAFRTVRPFLPPLNFITIHYAYFIVVPLVASVVFWGSSDPSFSISYVDSLFLVVSAMTEAGLNTVNLSQMTTWQQVMLWLLIMIGSSTWVSIWTILVRKRAFERRFREIVQRENERRLHSSRSTSSGHLAERLRSLSKATGSAHPASIGYASMLESGLRSSAGAPGDASGSVLPNSCPADERPTESIARHPAEGALDNHDREVSNVPSPHVMFAEDPRGKATSTAVPFGNLPTRRPVPGAADQEEVKGADSSLRWRDYLSRDKVGRNGQFHDLTSEERESLGGTEYRALKLLAVLVPLYSFLWQFLGCLSLGAWIATNQPGPARANAINPWWNGIFNGVSAFNNSGMTVLDANMVPYGSSYFVLIVMGVMILAGNTAYPIFLRLILWTGLKVLNRTTYSDQLIEWKITLEYILKYPRRVYTNLFPARQTWWLLFMLFVLNGTDWIAYEVLNFGNPALDDTPVGTRVIDGLFQALAVRSGGFYVVPMTSLFIGLQILYVIMMYISVYPVVITMRHSNVYEERSLGIYEDDRYHHDYVDSESSHAIGNQLTRPPSNRSTSSKRQTVSSIFRQTITAAWSGVGAGAVPAPSSPENNIYNGGDSGHHSDVDGSPGSWDSRISFVQHQVRSQLSHDLWCVVLAVLLIMIIETRHFMEDPVSWSVFNVVFEVVSAYGCVGITVGAPGEAFSFSGAWYTGSKLLLCLVMLRGRHRGLPVALDRAVRLPGDDLADEDDDDRIRRSISRVSSVTRRNASFDASYV